MAQRPNNKLKYCLSDTLRRLLRPVRALARRSSKKSNRLPANNILLSRRSGLCLMDYGAKTALPRYAVSFRMLLQLLRHRGLRRRWQRKGLPGFQKGPDRSGQIVRVFFVAVQPDIQSDRPGIAAGSHQCIAFQIGFYQAFRKPCQSASVTRPH